MVTIVELWLPILLSAVFVFVASSLIHMCIPLHKNDYGKLPGEDRIMDSMRGEGLQPGGYMFPCADSMKAMASPEMVEKLEKGPVGFLVVLPNGPMNMGKSLGQWFVFCLAVAAVTGFVASLGIKEDAGFGDVFKMTVATAFLGFALSNLTDSIWKGVSWVVTAKFIFDGAVYALVTAATFGWLWPAVV